MHIYEKEITGTVKFSNSTPDRFNFKIGGTIFSLECIHEQDCCEHVYADFESVELFKNQIDGKQATCLKIKKVENLGFLIIFGDNISMQILINCYNEQNGYYSNELSLKINSEIFDITDLAKVVGEQVED